MRVAFSKSTAVHGAWNRRKEREMGRFEKENLAEESQKDDRILLKLKIQKGQIVSHPLVILPIQHIVMNMHSDSSSPAMGLLLPAVFSSSPQMNPSKSHAYFWYLSFEQKSTQPLPGQEAGIREHADLKISEELSKLWLLRI